MIGGEIHRIHIHEYKRFKLILQLASVLTLSDLSFTDARVQHKHSNVLGRHHTVQTTARICRTVVKQILFILLAVAFYSLY